jgi:limonene-1,2-epoxide hydrolase
MPTPLEIANAYYDAWQNRGGDLGDVPIADDLIFNGPMQSFTDAASFRAMAANAGALVTSFTVRAQVADGSRVWSIIDWTMSLPGTGQLSSAEVLEIVDGQIVRGDLFYDADELRRAMAAAEAATT